jgi:HD-GYP domain-containing protein (c-di-GMP phosphodiesterase class II)
MRTIRGWGDEKGIAMPGNSERKRQPTRRTFSIFELIDALATALDAINPAIDAHHKQVCYIAATIAEELGLPRPAYNDLFVAAYLHDIGSLPLAERMKILEFEMKSPHLHAEFGYNLLGKFPHINEAATLVRFHHVPWKYGEGHRFRDLPVPHLSHLIHLADRIAVLYDRKVPVFSQVDSIRTTIAGFAGLQFDPEHVAAFNRVSDREVFWLDLSFGSLERTLRRMCHLPRVVVDLDELLDISKFFALVVDCRSRFTATHSGGIAACAAELGRLAGMSRNECKVLKIAGYVHDIGKLAVPNTILEKDGSLTPEEWHVMRSHTYHTRNILGRVTGLEEITAWAAEHHETLDGKGYPLRLAEANISLGSRIVAVSDIFTALSEDRPYRRGYDSAKIREIFGQHVAAGRLSREIVQLLFDHFDVLDEVRRRAQHEEQMQLADFWETARNGSLTRLEDADAARATA